MSPTVNRKVDVRGLRIRLVVLASASLLMLCCAVPAGAWKDIDSPILEMGYNPHGIFELDGDFVMNVGEAQVNITNAGVIGSAYSNPSNMSDAPSCQWPAGSGDEYLYVAGLWVGSVVLGERLVSQGVYAQEFLPLDDDLNATIYEAIGASLIRPPAIPTPAADEPPCPVQTTTTTDWWTRRRSTVTTTTATA